MNLHTLTLWAVVGLVVMLTFFTVFTWGAASRDASRRRRLRWTVGLLVASILGAAPVVASASAAEPRRVKAPPVRPSIKISAPVGTSNMCANVVGSVENWTDQYDVAVGVREASEDRWWFEGLTSFDQDRFSAQVELGARSDPPNGRYVLVAVLLPKQLHDYLTTSMDEPGATYWSGLGMPPGSIRSRPVEVVRRGQHAC